MDIKQITGISTLLVLINSVLAMPSVAQSKNTYKCLIFKNNPTTVVDTKRGKIQLISWKSNFFSNSTWTPQKRCDEVSKRFQKFSDNGTLRYVATGTMNRQSVICVAQKKSSGFGCQTDGLLLTLEPKDNPNTVLQELFDISARVSSGGLSRGGILDLEAFLNTAPVISTTTESTPTNNITPKDQQIVSPPSQSPCPPLLCPDNE